jgi:diguanylate cyclase (GGDEF)-like protein
MDAHAGTLAMAAGSLVAAALAIARAGRRQRSHRGWPCWMAAMLLGAGALLAAPAATGTLAAERVLQAGLVAWAPLLLFGLRRFHARLGLPASVRIDAAVLAAGMVGAAWMPGLAALGVQCYVAALMWSSRAPEDAAALRLLGTVVALLALPGALSATPGAGTPLLAQAAAAGLGLAVAAFVVLTLMGERTERELRASRRRLRVLANIDPLTSVPNRRHFHELAQRALRAPEADPPVLLVFDIDHFKLVNDRLGHAAGDRALQLVGRCMLDVLRARDIAGRLGGDEFALLLCGATLAQAMGVARRIVGQVQAQSPAHRLPLLGLSFGLVQMRPDESVDGALRRADQALYEAKRQGRSCAVAADGDESQPAFSESERLGLTPV